MTPFPAVSPRSRYKALVWAGVLQVGILASCGERDVMGPLQPPPLQPVPTFTLSGTVIEHTLAGPRPLGGFSFRVVTYRLSSYEAVLVTSDAEGRYSASGLPDTSSPILVPGPDSGFHAPCSVTAGTSPFPYRDRVLDFHVVSDALLETTGLPPSAPVTFPHVSGVVFERTFDGVRPVTGARVDFQTRTDGVGTLSDAAGRYLLCVFPPGAGTDQTVAIRAQKAGYKTEILLFHDPVHNESPADLELDHMGTEP